MKLNDYLQPIRERQPHLVTPFIHQYFTLADQQTPDKPLFYGKGSLKWALSVISAQATESQLRQLLHHIITELFTLPPDQVPNTVQFEIIKLTAMAPWRTLLNKSKQVVDVNTLPFVKIGGFKFIHNNLPVNLTSLIWRRTNADAVIFHNPETQSAGIAIRVNSKLNLLEGFKHYLYDNLKETEPGWNISSNSMIINYGIQSQTPTSHTIKSLQNLIIIYFKP